MEKRSCIRHRNCRVDRFYAPGGNNPRVQSATKGSSRSHHADRRAQFRFRSDLGGRAAQIFRAEGVRVKITPAPSGSVCLNAVVGRSTNFCASTSEGLVLARAEGAPAMAIQAHNRAMTLSVVLRKAIVDKLGLTRESPIGARLKALTQLGTIGATGPGAASEQIFKFLVKKAGADRHRTQVRLHRRARTSRLADEQRDRRLRALSAFGRNHRSRAARATS